MSRERRRTRRITEEDARIFASTVYAELFEENGYEVPKAGGFFQERMIKQDFGTKYKTFEDLKAYRSIWRDVIKDYEQKIEATQTKTKGNQEFILGDRDITIEAKIKSAEELTVLIGLNEPNFEPNDRVFFKPAVSGGITLGSIIVAFNPNQEEVLALANARPWGAEGGLKKLANMLKKPVRGISNSGAEYEFLPDPSVFK